MAELEDGDPFKEFGGSVITKTEEEKDPFAQFGGKVIKKKTEKLDIGGQPSRVGSNNAMGWADQAQPSGFDFSKQSAPNRSGYDQWKSTLPKRLQSEEDYDLKGYYNKYGASKVKGEAHLTDEFKLPNHPTFSNESIYFNDKTKNKAGEWQGDTYVPFDITRDAFDERNNRYIKNPRQPELSQVPTEAPKESYLNLVPQMLQEIPKSVYNTLGNVLKTEINHLSKKPKDQLSNNEKGSLAKQYLDKVFGGFADLSLEDINPATAFNSLLDKITKSSIPKESKDHAIQELSKASNWMQDRTNQLNQWQQQNPVPENLGTSVAKGISGMIPDIALASLGGGTKGAVAEKYVAGLTEKAPAVIAKYAPKAAALLERTVTAPFTKVMALKGAAEGGAQDAENPTLGIIEGGLKGAGEGMYMHVLGEAASKVSPYIAKVIGKVGATSELSTAIANPLATAGTFTAAKAVRTPIEEGRMATEEELAHEAAMGLGFSLLHAASTYKTHAEANKFYDNVLKTDPQAALGRVLNENPENVKANYDPNLKVKDLESARDEIKSAILKEPDLEVKKQLGDEAIKIQNQLDAKETIEGLVKGGESVKEMIDKLPELSPEQKEAYINRVAEIQQEYEPTEMKKNALSEQITQAEQLAQQHEELAKNASNPVERATNEVISKEYATRAEEANKELTKTITEQLKPTESTKVPVKDVAEVKIGDKVEMDSGKTGEVTAQAGDNVTIKFDDGGIITTSKPEFIGMNKVNPVEVIQEEVITPTETVQETVTPTEEKGHLNINEEPLKWTKQEGRDKEINGEDWIKPVTRWYDHAKEKIRSLVRSLGIDPDTGDNWLNSTKDEHGKIASRNFGENSNSTTLTLNSDGTWSLEHKNGVTLIDKDGNIIKETFKKEKAAEDISQKRNEEVLSKAEDDLKALKQVENKTAKYDASLKRLTEAKNKGEITTNEFNDLKKRFDEVIGQSNVIQTKIKEEKQNATEIREIEQGNLTEREGTNGQQQGKQENREHQEELVQSTESEARGSNRVLESGKSEEVKKESLEDLSSYVPNSGEVKKYLSGETIEKYEGESPTNNQEYIKQELMPALAHGIKIIDAAKERFGNDFVSKTLDFIENGKENVESKALMYVSLENELAKQKINDPARELEISKQQDLVRAKSQAYLRKNAIEINMGRLRKIAEAGYDINKVTSTFFSTEQNRSKQKIEKSLQADSEAINKEAERVEKENQGVVSEDVQEAITKGVEAQINEIYKKLPTERRKRADKAIEALTKIQKNLRSKTYEGTIGLPVAILDAGISTIKAAIKAGVNIADAIELGINKIKEKHENWAKEDEFRKDMLKGFKDAGVDVKEGIRIQTEEQKRKAYITKLKKDISSLDEQILKGEKTVVDKKDKYAHDQEISSLREERDIKREELNKIDPRQAEEAKLKSALKSAEKSLEEYQRKIDEEDFTTSEKENPKSIDEKLSELRDKRDNVKDEYNKKKKEYDESLITEDEKIEKQLSKDLNSTQKDIDRLNDKINGNQENVSTKQSSVWSKELSDLKKIKKELQDKISESRKTISEKTYGRSLKTPQERLADAKETTRQRIDDIREQIIDKKRELDARGVKVKKDSELTRLEAELESITKLRDKYLPKEENTFTDEKKASSASKRLLNEIADINGQINKGEKKEREASKDPYENEDLNKLKAEKKARFDMLELIDPTPKEFVKNALIDAGYGREINVNTKEGKETRQILDWKKLAGEEGSVTRIQENVEKALKDKGYSEADILRLQDAFVSEYNNLRASIVEKSLKELESRNTPKEPVDTKSSAQRLSELYNYGLFDKANDTYDYLMNKALGMNTSSQETFFRAKELAKALSDLYNQKPQGEALSELALQPAINNINHQLSMLLSKIAFQESNWKYKTAMITQQYMSLAQRALLTSLKQLQENIMSGFVERAFSKLTFMNEKADTPELKEKRIKIAQDMIKDITLNAGLDYGNVNNPFLSKNVVESIVNAKSKDQAYHAVVSFALGRLYLEGADSMHKVVLTENLFQRQLVKVLTNPNNPTGFKTNQEAINYISEQLTGQTYSDAQKSAKEVINNVNAKAGKKILPDNENAVNRLANSIVKDALAAGGKMTTAEVEASFNSAYTVAGFGMGHEANNPISRGVGQLNQHVEGQLKEAIKEKKWDQAALLTFESIIVKNILNPFVGGGTNWVTLTLQKAGLDWYSPLKDVTMKKSNPIDLTSPDGIKNLEKSLMYDAKAKSTQGRVFIGAIAGLLTYAAVKSSGKEDDIDEWIKKNEYLKKYFNVVSPQALILMLSLKNGEMKKYFQGLLNVRTDIFSDGVKFTEGASQLIEGIADKDEAKKNKGLGKLGDVIGGKMSLPSIPYPYKFTRDVQNLYLGITGRPQIKPDFTSSGFANGFYRTGMIEFLGLRPSPEIEKPLTPKQINEKIKEAMESLRKNELNKKK